MNRPPRSAAFTLVEMITVIAIIVILTGLILSINGLVQRKAATSRAQAEMTEMIAACEAYKSDNGGYPQDNSANNYTNSLDPRTSTSAATGSYANSSLFLYEALTGDTQATGQPASSSKNYAPDLLKPSRLGTNTTSTPGQAKYVLYIMDPFGNSYGYSTAALAIEQQFRQALAAPNGATTATRGTPKGYNPTFDLWSTGGSTGASTATWIKNW